MKKTLYWFALPALLLYGVFWIYPILTLLGYSVTDYNGLVKQYNFVGFDNFRQIFELCGKSGDVGKASAIARERNGVPGGQPRKGAVQKVCVCCLTAKRSARKCLI